MMSDRYFVTAEWLHEHLADPRVQILDARAALPQTGTDAAAAFRDGHIPGAVFFDIEQLSDHTTPLPHMLPGAGVFAVAMREMGICSDKHLVVYDDGSLFSAPRAWWMLRIFGAEKVSILAGGLAQWRQAQLPESQGDAVISAAGEFTVNFASEAVKRVTDVLLASHEGSAQIIDARAPERFQAKIKEFRPELRSGHIPGSVNVCWTTLVEHGRLKPAAELREIFHRQQVDFNRPLITTCGSGITAAVVLLALLSLEVKDVSLYDGSWSEWGSRQDLPVAP